MGFFRYQDNVPFPLPYHNFSSNTIRAVYSVHFANTGGNVRFSIQSTDGTALTDGDVHGSGPGIQAQYKYVLIPGGTPMTGKGAVMPWDKMTYREVCEALNIPE